MKKLRSYQQEAINAIASSSNCLINLPTGSGKTVLIWSYLHAHCKKALIIVPSLQIAEQVYEEGLHYFPLRQISAKFGKRSQKISDFHITTAQSFKNRYYKYLISQVAWDAVIIDEAHRSASPGYREIIDCLCPKKLIGLTATPTRHDKQSLLSIFGDIPYEKTIVDLIEQGYLCDIKAYRVKTNITLKHVTYRDGDFTTGCLFKQLANTARNNLILEAYKDNCQGLKTLLFSINIEHAVQLQYLFQEHGIKAQAIYGEMPLKHRKELIKDFKAGDIEVLINNQLLTEGFDEPSIQAVILARPTQSKELFTQMVGRGTRKHKSKEYCKVIDISDNYHRIASIYNLVYADTDFSSDISYEPGDGIHSIKARPNPLEQIEYKGVEAFNIFDTNAPDYLAKECGFDHFTTNEALFYIWKKNKMKEFYERKS